MRRIFDLILKLLRLMAQPALLELAAITLFGVIFISFSIPFEPEKRPDGLEHERLAGVVLPFEIGIKQYGHLPTWNPYIGLGEPTFNNPFNYLFNPFISLPVLLFGGVQGSKISMALGLLIAGFSMWTLARAIGLGGIARITTGTLYMMSGGIAAKFYLGHFQLGLSLAWPPLVFAGLWWILRSTDRRAPVLMAVAFMLLFFNGNIYYTLHTLLCCAFITLIHLVERKQRGWRWRFDRLKRVLVGGIFAFGLAMPQFMTNWAIRDFIYHGRDTNLNIRYDMGQALVNLIFPWGNWSVFENPDFNLNIGVDYAYIGTTVFLLIAGLIFAMLISPKLRSHFPARAALAAFILALIMMVWGAGQTAMVQTLYARIELLSEFRFIGRAHAIAALWWIVLAGIAVDALWRGSREIFNTLPAFDRHDRTRLLRAALPGIAVWLWFLIYSLKESTTSVRLGMVGNNILWMNTLDPYRFATFNDVLGGLGVFFLLAIAIDSMILILERVIVAWWKPHIIQRYGIGIQAIGTRLLRIGILLVALTAIVDIATVNTRLYAFLVYSGDFNEVEKYVLEHENSLLTPFPAIHEGHSPFAFSNYYNETRTWFLDEGWVPSALPSIIPWENGEIQDLPRWAIVWSNEGRNLSEAFVREFGYGIRLCIPVGVSGEVPDPCNLDARETIMLTEKANVLPYAFSAPTETIINHPGTINAANVRNVEFVSHRQDTITIRAEMPQNEKTHHLIVQETHFPGWTATIDGVPTPTVTIGRYIGIPMQPGMRTYILRFEPPGFTLGVVMFMITLILIGFYLRKQSD